LVGTTGIFAYQNNERISLDFLSWQMTASLAAVLGVAFVMGMLGGWALLGAVRRSLYTVTERRVN
jgi:uncharacterized integral membrane protein